MRFDQTHAIVKRLEDHRITGEPFQCSGPVGCDDFAISCKIGEKVYHYADEEMVMVYPSTRAEENGGPFTTIDKGEFWQRVLDNFYGPRPARA